MIVNRRINKIISRLSHYTDVNVCKLINLHNTQLNKRANLLVSQFYINVVIRPQIKPNKVSLTED